MRKTFRCGKHGKCKNPRPITAHEALTLLESAVSYCQQAGLQVSAANGNNGTLGLFVSNAHYVLTDNGTHAVFRLGTRGVSAREQVTAPGVGTVVGSSHG